MLDRIFGTSADYARTVDRWASLVHPDDRQNMLDYFFKQVVGEKRPFDREYRIVRQSDRQVRWVQGLADCSATKPGTLFSMLGTIQDITERKQAQIALQQAHAELERRVAERTAELTKANGRLQAEVQQRRQAEEQLVIFRRFAEAATQGFGMADVDGQITYVNPFLARLFGAQCPDDVIGTHVSTYYPADYLQRREREIIPALRRREHWQGEQMLAFPDGQMHPTIHSIFPVHDDNGELLCTAAVITDITELKQAEEKLRQSYEELRKSEERFDLAARGQAWGSGIGISALAKCTTRPVGRACLVTRSTRSAMASTIGPVGFTRMSMTGLLDFKTSLGRHVPDGEWRVPFSSQRRLLPLDQRPRTTCA